jgi:hypothetical protein
MMGLELALGTAFRNWKLIAGALIVLALTTALLLTRETLADVKVERDQGLMNLGVERANHAVTRGSVELLEQVVAARVAEANRAAAEYERSQAQAAKDLADANARYANTDARRKALERLATQTPFAPCPVPDDLRNALEGL